MTILLTGVNGLLGSRLKALLNGYTLIAPSRSDLDITDAASVQAFAGITSPDIILHCAAYTDVERAETDVEGCYKVNVAGTMNLIQAFHTKQPKFVFISSTGVYGKEKTRPYVEGDVPKPTTIYHQSKLEAEQLVKQHCHNFLILRTGWLFGGPVHAPKNFIYKRYLEAKDQAFLHSNPIQRGNPTFVDDVVRQIELLLEKDCMGLYNCVNQGDASRLEYIQHIVQAFGLSTQVLPVEGRFQRKADVSDNEMAENFYLNLMGLNVMPHFEQSLHTYADKVKAQLSAST
ncbi:MAG TPA: NAD(P)-dependent oxidoreductase [Saprospiraceae bacterium]|nr:NAD(P)-dependent oxidoreductase [Saprospiraceae bacterium]HMQ83901.1 NAD(P)-dependent oxidoreductase [Saprospiraceae bacterium]